MYYLSTLNLKRHSSSRTYIHILIIYFVIWYLIILLKNIEKLELVPKSATISYEYKQFNSICDCKKNQTIYLTRTLSGILKVEYSFKPSKYAFDSSELSLTCDYYNALRYGTRQKVIGYSLYGKNAYYSDGFYNLSKLVKKFYPNWIVRVYHDDTIDSRLICDIECQRDDSNTEFLDNIVFCNTNYLPVSFENTDLTWSASYLNKMMWRWLPLGDSLVEVFMSRDSDSLIIQREIDSVNVWLESNQIGHIMRDHPQHNTHILGGMWGFKTNVDIKLTKKIFSRILNKKTARKYNLNTTKGYDQRFLSDKVYSLIRSKSIIHDSYTCRNFWSSEPFPTQRIGNCFIGETGQCNLTASSFFECPTACRLANHMDWKYC